MKLLSILSAGLFATMTAFSFSVQAAEGTEAKSPAAETQTDKAPAKKAKRHSHMEEKTGVPASQSTSETKSDKAAAPDSKGEKLRADKDKSKHYHPRDGK